MLHEIRLRHLGVIAEAVVPLGPGLTALTGETGAGKTMVVTALGLLLGARSDAGLVRSGADHAYVEGVFDAPAAALPDALRDSLDIDPDEELILGRTVTREGRSRAAVGGRGVAAGVLAELGEHLVAVHGQADQWRLRSAAEHRQLLDGFGGEPLAAALAAYRCGYDRLAAIRARTAELERDRAARLTELDALRYGLESIAAVDPQPGEDLALRAEAERLAHIDGLRVAAHEAHRAVTGADDDMRSTGPQSALDLLARARAALAAAGGHDHQLDALRARLDELTYLVADLGSELGSYLADLDADPQRLATVNDRLAELGTLTRRYGRSTDDVLAWSAQAIARVVQLDGTDDEFATLRAEEEELAVTLGAAALRVLEARTAAAKQFEVAVTEELAHLAMGSAAVSVALERHADPGGLALPGVAGRWRYGRDGVDDVDIQLSAGSGSAARSVTKGASGGELSRVMLAIELVASTRLSDQAATTPTMVFDEVDAGVGGSAALEVAARLSRLARHTQVVVVTHLAQVAAAADHHLVVTKRDDGRVSSSEVHRVEGEARLAELSRMLGGDPRSRVGLEHAAALLSDAHRAPRQASHRASHPASH